VPNWRADHEPVYCPRSLDGLLPQVHDQIAQQAVGAVEVAEILVRQRASEPGTGKYRSPTLHESPNRRCRHESHVVAQIRELRETLDVMQYKVRTCEEHVAVGEADRLWNPSHRDALQAAHQECHRSEDG
jgi:hypothetical protein